MYQRRKLLVIYHIANYMLHLLSKSFMSLQTQFLCLPNY